MNQDIIAMARKADGHMNSHAGGIDMTWEGIERFAALVAAAEREEIAQFIEQTNLGSLPDSTALHYAMLLKSYSAAIRARGETK